MTDLTGRTFLVTGASAGIGLATAAELARRGGRVLAACRPGAKADQAVADIAAAAGPASGGAASGGASGAAASAAAGAASGAAAGAASGGSVRLVHLDLADLASVRRCAAEVIALGEPLHVLVNNAGVGGQRGRTADGFERHFGINHLGHFALTTALLPLLTASGQARIVNVASDAHYGAKGIDFDALRRGTASITGMREYAVSKLCNVLFTQELARRVDPAAACAYALHPGVVASQIWRRVPWPARQLMTRRMLTVEQGAQTSLYCATSPDLAGQSGAYYERCAQAEPSTVATPELAARLWEYSERWTGEPLAEPGQAA